MVLEDTLQKHTRLIAALELAIILIWTLWVGRAYLDMDPRMWPIGREFGMTIHPHFIWTKLTACGSCVLWNGATNGGSPTLAELHAAVAHPLVVLGTLLFGGVNGAKIALLGSLFTAGLAQWWLARALGLGPVPRLWSAGVAVAAGHLAGRMEHGTVGLVISTAACSLTLAPALKLALHGRRRDAVLLGGTLALALVAGQGYLQVGLLSGILPLFGLLLLERGARVKAYWREFVLALLLAGLLAGVFLVPLAHFWPEFGKELDPYFASAQPLAYIPFNFVISDVAFYQDRDLGKQPFGYLYMNFVGWVPVLLALLSLRLVSKDRRSLLLLFWMGIGMAVFMGSGIPLRWLSKILPGLAAGIRSFPVLVGLAVPFLLVLAAWGLDELIRLDWPRLALEVSSAGTRLGINTLYVVVPILMLWSLRSVYLFGQAWLRMLPQPASTYEVVAAFRTGSAEWVAMPFGEHFWAAVAGEFDLKLTQVVRPSHWRDRTPPPAYLRGDRQPDAAALQRASLHDVHIFEQTENRYAFVETSGEQVPCQARARGGLIEVTCTSPEEGMLVVRENAWSGWRAERDGRRVQLDMTGQWLSVAALAGEHVYRFLYRPWDVWLGGALSLAGIGLAIALWWPGAVGRARRWIALRIPPRESQPAANDR